MVNIQSNVESYLMPADAAVARQRLDQLLARQVEKWIIFYEASMGDFWANIKAGRPHQYPVHIVVDASMAKRPTERAQLLGLKAAGCEIVVSTSPLGKYWIVHSKVVACAAEPGQTDGECWEGSMNFSDASWCEPNTAMIFRSNAYRDSIQGQFEVIKTFALSAEPDLQL